MAHRKPTLSSLDRFPTYRLHQIAKLSDRASAEAYVEELGISLSEGRCLAAIGQYQPLSVQKLADSANLNKANASRAAEALAQRGLVHKESNQSDGRGVLLALSPEGRALWRKTMKLIAKRNAQIFDCLSDTELGQFDRMLDKLVGHLGAGDAAA